MTAISIRSRATALIRNGKWGKWIGRGTWTLLDRGLFALSNFGLNVVLARWMSPDAYGAFAIAFSIFLIMGAAQSTMVTGPLLVFGPRRYQDRYPAYLGLAIKGQFALSLVVSLGLALVGAGFLLYGSRDTGIVLLALALSGPFILLMWLLRSSNYAQLQSKGAAISGAIYLVVLLAGAYLFFKLGILTPATALFLMAATSLVVAIQLAIRQKADLFAEKLRGAFAREVALEHWRYARWMLPAQMLTAGRSNLFFFVLPIWGGLEATGALRALMNLVMPIAFMQNSLQLITVPILVRARSNKTLLEKVIVGTGFFVTNALVYGLLLILFQDQIVNLLYSNRYADYAGLVTLIAFLPIVNSLSMVLGSALRAMERPKAVFWTTVAAAVCAVVVGLPLIAVAGALGAAIALLASACTMAVLTICLIRSAFRQEAATPAPQSRTTARDLLSEPNNQE